jgi:transcription elongation factor GreA
VDTEVVQVGNAVKVRFDDGKEQTFTIVGSAEAKPPARLSNESPIGKALLGHRTGDAIEVSLPNGLQAPPAPVPESPSGSSRAAAGARADPA